MCSRQLEAREGGDAAMGTPCLLHEPPDALSQASCGVSAAAVQTMEPVHAT